MGIAKMLKNILRQQGWLSLQPDSFQNTVLEAGRILQVDRGKTLFSVGDSPGGVYAIVHGEVAIEIASSRAGPHLMHIATPGVWLGEASFLTGEPRLISFQTVDATELFHLPLEEMERITKNDSESMRRFAKITTSNLSESLRKIEILLDPDPARRVAATLLQCFGDQARSGVTVSQTELGRMSNVSRNTVVRVLRDFGERGWVRTGYGHIRILKPNEMDQYCSDK